MLTAPPPNGNFRLGSQTASVQFNEEADSLRWLREFVEPWFAGDQSDRPGTTIDVVFDPLVDERISRSLAAANDEVVCLLLDRGPVSFPAVRSAGMLAAVEIDRGCVYEVDDANAVITIFARPGRRPRLAVMRVLREVLAGRMRARPGVLDLHAAAIGTDVGGVVICGARRAGKTTTTCRALAAGAALISNDRVLLDMQTSTSPIVRGVPTIVSLRAPVDDLFPVLRNEETRRSYLRTTERAAPGEPGHSEALAPADLANRLGSTPLADAPLAAFVFPRFTDDRGRPTFEPVADLAALLRASRYAGDHYFTTTAIAAPAPAPTAENVEAAIEALTASGVVGVWANLQTNAFGPLDRWLAELSEIVAAASL